jgi:hypothetical protein
MQSVMYAECRKLALYAECNYAECHYAEGHYAECHYVEFQLFRVSYISPLC